MKKRGLLVLGAVFALLLNVNISYAKEYACEYDNGGFFRYDPDRSDDDQKKSCESWKKPFWGEDGQKFYEDCLKNVDEQRKFYNAGKCKPILTKTLTKGGSKCDAYYYITKSGQKKSMGYACSGKDISELKSELEKMFK